MESTRLSGPPVSPLGTPAPENLNPTNSPSDEPGTLHYLYVGVVCHDSTGADQLRVRDLRRDFDETTDDFFGIAIDGVQDGRSAMVFRVNPRGALRDQQTVEGGLADVDFDAVWIARTARDERGWTAELAIPWNTLRYRAGHGTWNVNFQRMHRRKNESSGWSPWPRVMQPFRMDYGMSDRARTAAGPQPAPAALRARRRHTHGHGRRTPRSRTGRNRHRPQVGGHVQHGARSHGEDDRRDERVLGATERPLSDPGPRPDRGLLEKRTVRTRRLGGLWAYVSAMRNNI